MASRGDINRLLQTVKFKEICSELYGIEHLESQILRYEVLLEEFTKNFAGSIDRLYSSPGRIELVGNHTDHNNGKVLCAAIKWIPLRRFRLTVVNLYVSRLRVSQ
jgi:hypothetical protein